MSKEALIEECLSWVGYIEKASNSQLEDKTANPGSANWTLFGKWYGDNIANSSAFYATAWCAMFISYCSCQAGTGEQTGYYAYCPYWVNSFKSKSQWNTSNPQAGDIIFFQSGGVACHVGIITEVSGNTIKTCEGNSGASSVLVSNGGTVCTKSYTVGSSYILGYGRPTYTFEPDINNCPYSYSTSTTLKSGSIGQAVYAFQWYATAYGEDTGGIDGQYGDKSVQACKNIQTRFSLEVDGICGANTWNALINNYNEAKGELTLSQYTELREELNTVNELTLQRYNNTSDLPSWATEAVKYYMNNGVIQGVSDSELGLSYNDLRYFVWEYRMKDIN